MRPAAITYPPNKPIKSAMIVKKRQHRHQSDQSGRHQLLNWISAQRAHRIDLLRDAHRPDFARDTAGVRPATRRAVSTGPSSRTSVIVTICPICPCAPYVVNARAIWSAITMPLKIPIRLTINKEPTPITSI